MNTAKAILLCAAAAVAGAAGCRTPAEGSAGSEPDAAGGAGVATAVPFAHERRAALSTDEWGGMRVDWTAVADWPIGDSPAAKAARAWIEEQFRYRGGPFDGDPEDRIRLPRSGEPFDGDPTDWDAMTRFHGGRFLAENGPKQIEAWWKRANLDEAERNAPLQIKAWWSLTDIGETERKATSELPRRSPGRDVFLETERQGQPRWHSRHSATIEYEDDWIVSYRAGLRDFQVGNQAGVRFDAQCATFRKTDGKRLGWEDFTGNANDPDYGGEITGPLVTRDGLFFFGDFNVQSETDDEVAFRYNCFPWGEPATGGASSCGKPLPHEAKVDYGLVASLAPEWPGCYYRRWHVAGPMDFAVVYRVERDGSKRLVACQSTDGAFPRGDDHAFFDVDGDGALELILKDCAGMSMHPRVNIWKLSDSGSSCCWSEQLIRALVPEFRPEDNWWTYAWDMQLDAASNCIRCTWARKLRDDEIPEPAHADEREDSLDRLYTGERATIPFERLRNIRFPFEPFKPEAINGVKPEDL